MNVKIKIIRFRLMINQFNLNLYLNLSRTSLYEHINECMGNKQFL